MIFLADGNRYTYAAERCLKIYWPALEQAGNYHSSLCTALAEFLHPSNLLILRVSETEVEKWQAAIHARYLPDVMRFS